MVAVKVTILLTVLPALLLAYPQGSLEGRERGRGRARFSADEVPPSAVEVSAKTRRSNGETPIAERRSSFVPLRRRTGSAFEPETASSVKSPVRQQLVSRRSGGNSPAAVLSSRVRSSGGRRVRPEGSRAASPAIVVEEVVPATLEESAPGFESARAPAPVFESQQEPSPPPSLPAPAGTSFPSRRKSADVTRAASVGGAPLGQGSRRADSTTPASSGRAGRRRGPAFTITTAPEAQVRARAPSRSRDSRRGGERTASVSRAAVATANVGGAPLRSRTSSRDVTETPKSTSPSPASTLASVPNHAEAPTTPAAKTHDLTATSDENIKVPEETSEPAISSSQAPPQSTTSADVPSEQFTSRRKSARISSAQRGRVQEVTSRVSSSERGAASSRDAAAVRRNRVREDPVPTGSPRRGARPEAFTAADARPDASAQSSRSTPARRPASTRAPAPAGSVPSSNEEGDSPRPGRRTPDGSVATPSRATGRGSVKGARTKQTSTTTKDEEDDIDELDNYPPGFLQKIKALRATKLQAAASNRAFSLSGSSSDSFASSSSQKLVTETAILPKFNKAEYVPESQRPKKEQSNTLEDDGFRGSLREKSRKVSLLVAPSPPPESSGNPASLNSRNRPRDSTLSDKETSISKFNASFKSSVHRNKETKNEVIKEANTDLQYQGDSVTFLEKKLPSIGSNYRNRYSKPPTASESENLLTSNGEERDTEVSTRSGLLGRPRPPQYRPPLPTKSVFSKSRTTVQSSLDNIPNYRKTTTTNPFEDPRLSSGATPKFSARYRTDTFRGTTNTRTTPSPAYIPTVPTVTTPSAENIYYASRKGSSELGKASYH